MSEDRRYFVYVTANASKRLYTGMTNSIRRRVREHELKLTPGYAAQYNITRLVYFESFEDVRNAIEREKQIKAWTRAKRLALVESTNPKWDDLSREWDQPQTFRLTPNVWVVGGLNRPPPKSVIPSAARDVGFCLECKSQPLQTNTRIPRFARDDKR
ncbi:MAG TPA: GIY-YIG nuclease family protein [Candidatus Dormibacteraeota bacterium]|jgi:putative endonuclease|nr:GIY-YIG nuclease family protein [Candidatus Dormibacteraeota bacterium]